MPPLARHPNRHLRALALAILAVGVALAPVRAQDVHGVVRDSATARPIPGALISLLDSAAREIARTLTDRNGRYAMPSVHAAVRIRVLHIGHLPRELQLTGTETLNITMSPVPQLLDAVNTRAARPFGELAVCTPRADEAQALGYWNQARSEAQDAFVVRDSSPGAVRLAIYYRDVEPSTGRVTHQSVTMEDGSSANPALAARSKIVFPEVGRLHDAHVGTDQSVVYGAGIDLLIDDHFTRRHCFHMASPDPRHQGEIGVAFGPGQSQLDFPDMQGVLWIDPSERAVRTVEFVYVSNFSPTPLAGNLGGSLHYRLLPTGAGLIESWSERLAPEELYKTGMKWNLTSSLTTLETGAELLSAAWPDSVHWSSATGVTGRVACQGSRAGVPDLRLWLDGTDYEATTDSAGGFRFDGVVPGPYRLASNVPLRGPRGDAVDVVVVRDSSIQLDLTARAARCGGP